MWRDRARNQHALQHARAADRSASQVQGAATSRRSCGDRERAADLRRVGLGARQCGDQLCVRAPRRAESTADGSSTGARFSAPRVSRRICFSSRRPGRTRPQARRSSPASSIAAQNPGLRIQGRLERDGDAVDGVAQFGIQGRVRARIGDRAAAAGLAQRTRHQGFRQGAVHDRRAVYRHRGGGAKFHRRVHEGSAALPAQASDESSAERLQQGRRDGHADRRRARRDVEGGGGSR